MMSIEIKLISYAEQEKKNRNNMQMSFLDDFKDLRLRTPNVHLQTIWCIFHIKIYIFIILHLQKKYHVLKLAVLP